MNRNLFWTGLILQLIHLVALSLVFLKWDIELVMWVALGVIYVLFNIATVIMIVLGLTTNDWTKIQKYKNFKYFKQPCYLIIGKKMKLCEK